ncbi:flagellar type III secretion system pore protein FliP [Pseudomonas citronellolis]|uniref:flagellar type III secretion system pore protein FliP n=1 Tax=Pseudomonas citronellolis TaxID=53408 RepID=UPI00209E670C|nr:flagellar type III secretion system pore protein FliP [Pseudomonas citronellolis]MCP1640575.1 flagellar biosynthetic protein FliP [Pseudomonas citronellolis]MCP1663495.1 flagellar biosynthetic protein FliP [Pseudomonas citronellolis]MCP1697695.1 flagellar biosynthetic protein FliP [Pseudomonas citronellolis]MCP1701694.1 flagellar biosynthetic protein FliP [Pseudomonas citronellolis]MCP1795281.1 flagellar biosynthetic protein FliP [Pseudomonas citronellolis]
MKRTRHWLALGLALAGMLPGVVLAAGGEISLLSLNDTGHGQELSVKLQILVVMTLLGLLPAMLLMMTSFTRFIIVLAILRQAMGLQQSPPNNVLVGIALCMTLLVMRPVWKEVYTEAYEPFQRDAITLEEGLGKAKASLSRFMLAQTGKTSLDTLLALASEKMPADKADLDFSLLLPAYVLSELKTAFQLGFMIFVPFLVIDLVVASVLMAMGMMMLSPMMISLPFKLMVFVLVDGWALLMGTLTSSIQPF